MPRKIERYTKTIVLCCEGTKTEPRYLCDLGRLNPRCFLDFMPHRYTGPVEISKYMISNVKQREIDKSIEYWCVFDDDNRDAEVREAYRLIKESNSVHGRAQIKIALCKPCFEFWALLHFVDKPSDIKDLSTLGCQRMLNKYMPTYDHNKNPVVDINKMMPNYDKARNFALVIEKNCDEPYETSKFASIYTLIDSVLSA